MSSLSRSASPTHASASQGSSASLAHSGSHSPLAGHLHHAHGSGLARDQAPCCAEHQATYPTSAEGYDVYEEIGVGAFSTVYRGAVRGSGEEVAVKVIDLERFNANWDEIRQEILCMSLVHHPNVVRILTSFVDEQDLWIVMPLMHGGSCAHIMKAIFPHGMKDEALVATILKEVLMGLLYFHNDGRLHRDLKAGNILISSEGDVQLADMGVAGTLLENGDRKKMRTTFTGTPCWMAPEVMEHNEEGYDEKADVWSFGITALELAYGRAPYARYPPMKVMVLTLQEDPPNAEIYRDHSYEFSRHFHAMVEKALRKDPAKRPNVKKLLEHKFFKQAKDRHYIVEKIMKRLPAHSAADARKQPLNLAKLRHPTLASGEAQLDDEKPVSVGSWVFDKEEFDEMKRQVADEKARNEQAVQASYYSEDSPRDAAASSSAAAPSSQALRPPAGHNVRSAVSSGSEESEDEERVRGGVQALSVNVQPPSSQSPPVQMRSPNEHQEGRFMVSDDADDGEDVPLQDHLAPSAHARGSTSQSIPTAESNSNSGPRFLAEDSVSASNGARPDDGDAQGGEGGEAEGEAVDAPDFHNEGDSYAEQEQEADPSPPQTHHGEHHVGRFAVRDDQDDD